MKLYSHQQKILDEDPKKCGLFLGTGSGKSLIGLSLAQGKTLVIVPKILKEDRIWERQLSKMDKILDITAISKETFRRDAYKLPAYDTVIVDEAHTCLGVTPNTKQVKRVTVPKTSQLFEALQTYLERTNPSRLYLCTATIMKSPMTVWAAGVLLGKKWDFYQWRNTFHVKLPMPGREVYSARSDDASKDRLAVAVRSIGYTGRLSDFVDVPEQTHIVKHIPLTPDQIKALREIALDYPDPIVLLGKRHQIEQGILTGNEYEDSQTFDTGKIEAIIDLCNEYEKVLVFAKYTNQIQYLTSELRQKGMTVFLLTGQTQDKGWIITQANESKKCVVIAQSSISAGYELPDFRCTIFASESWSLVDHEQALGRTLRINNLQKNLYVYLVSGEVDQAIRKCIENKKDFDSRIYLNV